ncbi:MAG: Crp/Fnr family transcriptional regulator [Prevotella sp.]
MPFHHTFSHLPLFQGLTEAELVTIAGNTKLEFKTISAGQTVVEEGKKCESLHFLLKGTLRVESYSHNHKYHITELISHNIVLQPERMFGLRPLYTRIFIAENECRILILKKNDVMRLSSEFIIFRINLINIISAKAQKVEDKMWFQRSGFLPEEIYSFIELRCIYPAGYKILHIRMKDLAHELNMTRQTLSKRLKCLQNVGIVSLRRNTIEIPRLEDFYKFIQHS